MCVLIMWESPGRNNNNNSSRSSSYIVCSSSSASKSSSTCSFSSPAPSSPPSPDSPDLQSSAKKSMEEVWNDISLASLNDHPPAGTVISPTNNNHPTFPGMIFQDFLARPLNKEPQRRSNTVSLSEELNLFGPLAPTPGTILSLNTGSDFQYIETSVDPTRPDSAVVNGRTGVSAAPSLDSSHPNSTFRAFGSSEVFPYSCKRRAEENNSDDRRYKRMMKNRESAARSRARRQAYTNELELEVAHLLEENAKLRRQHEKLLAAPPPFPKKNTLTRSLTAPF